MTNKIILLLFLTSCASYSQPNVRWNTTLEKKWDTCTIYLHHPLTEEYITQAKKNFEWCIQLSKAKEAR